MNIASRRYAARQYAVSPGDSRLLAALCVASFLAALNFFATSPFYPVIARRPRHDRAPAWPGHHSDDPGQHRARSRSWPDRRSLRLPVARLSWRLGSCPERSPASDWRNRTMSCCSFSVAGGLADALVFGLPLAIARMRFSGAAQRKAMGWTIGSLSSASIIGTPILTSIGSVASWRVALVAAGIAAVGGARFIFRSLPTDSRQADRHASTSAKSARPTCRCSGIARRCGLYGTTVFRAVTWIGLMTYLGAFLADELGLNTRNVGFVYMTSGIGYAVGSVVGSKALAFSPRLIVAASCLIAGLAVGALLLVSSVVLAIVLVVLASLISALAGIGLASILANESPAGTGTTMVLNGSMMNLGSAGGALLGGVFISLGGYHALGIGLPLFSVAAAVLAWWPSRGD